MLVVLLELQHGRCAQTVSDDVLYLRIGVQSSLGFLVALGVLRLEEGDLQVVPDVLCLAFGKNVVEQLLTAVSRSRERVLGRVSTCLVPETKRVSPDW